MLDSGNPVADPSFLGDSLLHLHFFGPKCIISYQLYHPVRRSRPVVHSEYPFISFLPPFHRFVRQIVWTARHQCTRITASVSSPRLILVTVAKYHLIILFSLSSTLSLFRRANVSIIRCMCSQIASSEFNQNHYQVISITFLRVV